MRTMILLTLGAMWLPVATRAASPSQVIDWPDAVAAKIRAIRGVKQEAMALPRMRTKVGEPVANEGIMGKRVDTLMDELGGLITDEKLTIEITKQGDSDICARIALWAIDRKSRKDEYERFAKYYVNAPDLYDQEECIEYFSRPRIKVRQSVTLPKREPESYIPRPGTWSPNPIDKEDQIEKNRFIIEYCYFMPPSGRRFDRDNLRESFAKALRELPTGDRTVLIFTEDAEVALRVLNSKGLKQFPKDGNQSALRELCKIITPESFSALSEFWQNPAAEETIRTFLTDYWAGNWAWYGRYPESLEDYQKWVALARRPWKEDCEKEFAKWLLSVPEPVNP